MKTDKVNFYLKSTLVKTPFDVDDDHIKAVEKIVRDSAEYKAFIADKRVNEDENRDVLLTQFDFKDAKKAKLQLHHDVYLYDLVGTAYQYLVSTTKDFVSTFQVADLVMEWHYRNIVPYVFLSVSAHQLYHDGKFKYENSAVKGNYKDLYDEYKEFLPNDAKERLEELINE
jgi:hypothetical protein